MKMKLITERLKLISCNETILEEIIEGNIQKFEIAEGFLTEDTLDALPIFLAMLKTGECKIGYGIWLMVLKGTNLVVGGCGFVGNPDKNGNIETGYSISPKYRRQGLTFEAQRAIIKWAFEQDDVKLVSAKCEKSNVGSIKLIEKLGMKFVKSNKKFFWYNLKNNNK